MFTYEAAAQLHEKLAENAQIRLEAVELVWQLWRTDRYPHVETFDAGCLQGDQEEYFPIISLF